jgi:hypothetical protein
LILRSLKIPEYTTARAPVTSHAFVSCNMTHKCVVCFGAKGAWPQVQPCLMPEQDALLWQQVELSWWSPDWYPGRHRSPWPPDKKKVIAVHRLGRTRIEQKSFEWMT